jgi:hypothetical protein
LSAQARKGAAAITVTRARLRKGRLEVAAAVARTATGKVRVTYKAGGRTLRFDQTIRKGTIRIARALSRAMRRAASGVLTLTYAGDARVRSDAVTLRAAARRSGLKRRSSTISGGRLRVAGTISKSARGTVRVRIEYVENGALQRRTYSAKVRKGRWTLDVALPPAARAGGHLSILFSGDVKRRLWGEQLSRAVTP